MIDVFISHCLKGCGVLTLPWAMYICMLIKGSIDYEFPKVNEDPGYFNKIARLVVFGVCFLPAGMPVLPYQLSGVENQYL